MAIRYADVFRAFAMVLMFGLVANAQQLQQSSPSQGRYATGGWTASSPNRVAPQKHGVVNQAAAHQNYSARFVPQENLSGLPAFPDSSAGSVGVAPPALPDGFPGGSLSDMDSGPGTLSAVEIPVTPPDLQTGPMSSPASSPSIDRRGQIMPTTNPLSLGSEPRVLPPHDPTASLRSGAPAASIPASQPFDGSRPSAGISMPMMGETGFSGASSSPLRPVEQMAQPASHSEQGNSELRVKQGGRTGAVLPQRQIVPNQADTRPRLPAQAITTAQPFVSPARPRGNYATRPINPAFYQMAAFQRGAPTNVAIGTYPRSAYPGNSQGQAAVTRPAANLAQQQYTPARFTSNASPMQATTVATTQQQARQNPGFYQTAFTQQCNEPGFPSTGINGTYVPPTITPGGAPGLYAPSNAGYQPLFTLGQENYNVALGRGIVGQPTVYVAGQPVRNFFRYVFP